MSSRRDAERPSLRQCSLDNINQRGVQLRQWARKMHSQTMTCVAAFHQLPTCSDQYLFDFEVRSVHDALMAALTEASKALCIHTGDPVLWAIWLVQDAHAIRRGCWKVHSLQSQLSLSFLGMFVFLEFKKSTSSMKGIQLVRPPVGERRRDAQRLSEWLVAGGSPPLHPDIVEQFAPALALP